MHSDELHKGAFWIYGVIVALAIREPLTHVVPNYISLGLSNWSVQLEVWRLTTCLLMTIRFYLGAALFFNEVYVNEQTSGAYVEKNYPIDFLGGLFHFTLFFSWSITVSSHLLIKGEVSHYLAGLIVVLLYDNVWYWASWRFSTKEMIRKWVSLNNGTALAIIVLYLGSRLLLGRDQVFSEHLVLVPVLGTSIWDVKKMLAIYTARNP